MSLLHSILQEKHLIKYKACIAFLCAKYVSSKATSKEKNKKQTKKKKKKKGKKKEKKKRKRKIKFCFKKLT